MAEDEPAPDQPESPAQLQKKAKPGDKDAEQPPVPAEKKAEPPSAKPAKPKMDEKPGDASEPEIDEQETLNRVSKNVRLAEERLGKKELTEGTRQVQRDILDDLDALINLQKQPPPDDGSDSSSAGAGGSQSKNKQGQQASRQGQGGTRGQAGGAAGSTKTGSREAGGRRRAEAEAARPIPQMT